MPFSAARVAKLFTNSRDCMYPFALRTRRTATIRAVHDPGSRMMSVALRSFPRLLPVALVAARWPPAGRRRSRRRLSRLSAGRSHRADRSSLQTFPVTFEYVGQTQGSKDVEVRARVTGIIEKRLFEEGAAVKAGQPLFIIDARQYQAQVAAANADVARARGAEGAGRPRARAAEAARRAQGDRAEGSRRRRIERRPRRRRRASRAGEGGRAAASISATRRSSRRSPGLTSRAQKSEGSLATANETLLTTISQIESDLGRVQHLRKRAAAAQPRRRREPARAAEGQCVRGDGQAVGRLDASAQGPHQLLRHADQSDDRARTKCARRSPMPTAR